MRRQHIGKMLAGGALLSVMAAGAAQAATITWTGAVDKEWTETGNWLGNALPGPDDTALFTQQPAATPGTANANVGVITMASSQVIHTLRADSSNGNPGSPVQIGVTGQTESLSLFDITNAISANQGIDVRAPVVLRGDGTFFTQTGVLWLRSDISDGGNAYHLTLESNNRTIRIYGNNTYSGGTTILAQTGNPFEIHHNNAFGTGLISWERGSLSAFVNNVNVGNQVELAAANLQLRSNVTMHTWSGDIGSVAAASSANQFQINLLNDGRTAILAGNNTYAHTTHMMRGVLQLDGSLSHANFTDIASNARTLTGSGLINWNFDGDSHDFMNLPNTTLNIENLTLNFIFDGLQTLDEYVIGAYGTLQGSEFASITGLGNEWDLLVNGTDENPGNFLVLVRQLDSGDGPVVPEPATMGLLGLGGLMLLARRGRREV